jgi:hypothetical protein
MRWIRSELDEDWVVRGFRLMRNDLDDNWVGLDLSRIRTELGALQMKVR